MRERLHLVVAIGGLAWTGCAVPATAPAPALPEATSSSVNTPQQVFDAIGTANLESASIAMLQQASAGSAPRTYLIALLPILVMDEPAAESSCPEYRAEGDTEVIRGGCVAPDGVEWLGEVRLERREGQLRVGRIEFDRFGYRRTLECPEVPEAGSHWTSHGTFSAVGEDNDLRYSISIAFDGHGVDQRCEPFLGRGALEYEGRLRADGSRMTWNGQGRLGWETFGWFHAETENEVTDTEACPSKALSGVTTLSSQDHTVALHYDGDTRCEEAAEIPWTRDGEPQASRLAPVACSAHPGRGGWLSLLMLALVAYRNLSRRARSRAMFF